MVRSPESAHSRRRRGPSSGGRRGSTAHSALAPETIIEIYEQTQSALYFSALTNCVILFPTLKSPFKQLFIKEKYHEQFKCNLQFQ